MFSRRNALKGTAGLAALGLASGVDASDMKPVDFDKIGENPAKKQSVPIEPDDFYDFRPFNGNHADVLRLLKHASTRATWDFNTALGDTIKEKYESLYIRLLELSNVMVSKGAAGYFYIITSPEVASIFETATAGFAPLSSSAYARQTQYWRNGQLPMGVDMGIQEAGVINARWRLYKSSKMPADPSQILVGAGPAKGPASHFGVIHIANFII